MDLDKLTESIDRLVKKLNDAESQVGNLKQRESELLTSNKTLQEQINQAQNKIQHIITRLKSIEEPA
jgi:uncharacterized protein (TIGR02449 family)